MLTPAHLTAPGAIDDAPLTLMLNQLAAKRSRNITRTVYAEGKNALRDLGISLPPQMRDVEMVLGWPMKAVNVLASRCTFDGFVIPGSEQDPFGLAEWLADNNADSVLPQAITSALIHSVSFLTTTPGDTSRGEPDVLMLPKPATQATGIWDARTGSLAHALTIEVDTDGLPIAATWFARDFVLSWSAADAWAASLQPNPLGRVWVEPLVFKPDLDRPFGRSRISRAVMSLTDAGLRSMARSESHAEFFASPQRYALGVEEEAFGSKADKWNAVMSRMLTITRDENGDIPTLGQFQQMSMQPHFDHLRMWAALFAGETSVPLSALGIVQDNPASAEAIYAAKEDLVIEASSAGRVFGSALRRSAVTAVMLRDGLSKPPPELRGLRSKWRNPATPSVVSAADATVKKVSALPWLAESEVTLEDLGYDAPTITRLLADRRRAEGTTALQQARAAVAARQGVSSRDDPA